MKRTTVRGCLPPPPFRLFFGTRSSAARLAMLFMRACATALFLSDMAAFRRFRSFIRFIVALKRIVGHETIVSSVENNSLHAPSSIFPPNLLGPVLSPPLPGVLLLLSLLVPALFLSERVREPPNRLSSAFAYASLSSLLHPTTYAILYLSATEH